MLTNTDTIPGLSCDARNSEAVRKIIAIKKRASDKLNFVVLVSSDRILNQCIDDIPEIGWDLIDCATSPLTLIFDGAKSVASECMGEGNTLAIRYIKDGELKQLLDRVQCPMVSTSANISGQENPTVLSKVHDEVKKQVDLIWESKTEGSKQASTIMKLKANGEFTFIRK